MRTKPQSRRLATVPSPATASKASGKNTKRTSQLARFVAPLFYLFFVVTPFSIIAADDVRPPQKITLVQ
jgi:hypothetical protein